MKIAEIKAPYLAKMGIDKEAPHAYYIFRPISWYLTWVCLKLKISKNLATLIGVFIYIIACSVLFYGLYLSEHWIVALSGILIALGMAFDFVDGNIARYQNKSTQFGTFLDKIADYFNLTLMAVAVGAGLYFTNHWYLVICMIWAFALLFKWTLSETLSACISVMPHTYYKVGNSLWKRIYNLGIAVERSYQFLLIIFALLNLLHIFAILWAIEAVGSLFVALTYTIYRGVKSEAILSK